MADLQKGSADAFEQLVSRLTAHLVGFLCSNWSVGEADAEEIASDVLWTVHQNIRKFRHGGSAKLTTWLFEIAKNRAIDHFRKTSSSPQQLEVTERTLPAGQPAPRFAGRNSHMMAWLNEQLIGLAQDDQDVLKWRAMDFSYEQIAGWLGISEGAARVRHKRAMDKLIEAGKLAFAKDTANG